MGAEMVRGFGAPVGNSAGVSLPPSVERKCRGVSGEGGSIPPAGMSQRLRFRFILHAFITAATALRVPTWGEA
jgi:hypothetical protein